MIWTTSRLIALIALIPCVLSCSKLKDGHPAASARPQHLTVGRDTLSALFATTSFTSEFPTKESNGESFTDFSSAVTFSPSEYELWSRSIVSLNGSIIARGSRHVTRLYSQAFESPHHWRMTSEGSSAIELDDSVEASAPFRVVSPRSGAPVSRESGVTILYGDPGTDSVEIELSFDTTLTSLFLDTTVLNAPATSVAWKQANSGRFQVDSSVLAGDRSNGLLQIWITAERKKLITHNGHKFLLRSRSTARSWLKLQD